MPIRGLSEGSMISSDVFMTIGSIYFEGQIDDIRIYDRVLSVSEISRIYNQTKSKYQ